MYVGHAGWAPGQLDNEVERGDWHIVPADIDTLFRKPAENMWSELIQRSAGRWVGLQPPRSADHGPG
jgi:putative transcriptional regulator